ncbi:MAG: hypothetical protein ACRCX5_05260 [Bacteroidales bacterium]
MKDFIKIFEYILTELNIGTYYNPLQHTDKQNESFVKKNRCNEVAPMENGNAKFEGYETFESNNVLVFSFESFRFKMPIDVFVMSFSKNLKALDIKPSDIKKESEYNETEIKAISRLKKVTDKKVDLLYKQCVYFLHDIQKAFVSNGSCFAITSIDTNKSDFEAYNVIEKEKESELRGALNEQMIKKVSSFEAEFKITFDVKVLVCVLKSLLLRGATVVRLSETYDLYFNIELLAKVLSFVPKKQKTVEFLVKNNRSCVHFFTVNDEHVGIMPSINPDSFDYIDTNLVIEEKSNYSMNYFSMSDNTANKEPECIASNEDITESKQSGLSETDSCEIAVELTKDESECSICYQHEENTGEPITHPCYKNKAFIYERINCCDTVYPNCYLFYDVDIGILSILKNEIVNKQFRIRNKSSTLNHLNKPNYEKIYLLAKSFNAKTKQIRFRIRSPKRHYKLLC